MISEVTYDKRYARKKRKLREKYPEVFDAYNKYHESHTARDEYYYDNIFDLRVEEKDLRASLVRCTFDERVAADKRIEFLKVEIERLEEEAPYSKEQVLNALFKVRKLITEANDRKLKEVFYLDGDIRIE